MPRQSDLRFTFEPQGSAARFDVIEFRLEEALSQPFRLSLDLSSHDPDIDFAGLLDNEALFTLWHGERPIRYVHGLISRFTIGHSGFRRTHYHAVVEPHLARLDLCSNWRIFQQLSVPQILDKVLEQHRLSNRQLFITAPHQPREYCVQAGETDLHFLARLAAEEGLLFSFEHSPKGHRLVYHDRVQGLGQIGPAHDCAVLFQGNAGGDAEQPSLQQFRYTEQVRSARQVQRDYTFTHPRYNQEHQAGGRDLQHQSGTYERYDYPGRYKRDAAGQPFTQTRLLALRNDARIAQAIGDDARLRPGKEFELQGHPREAFNTFWRTVSIEHHGVQHSSQEEDCAQGAHGTRYSQTAVLIDARRDWKAQVLDKPRIDGQQTATVVGPPGEEIYCDEWGRVKLSFPWDRDSPNDHTSSCWVRVSQGWAGTTWGAMAIPRIGQEVIVGFHDGDADQPIVMGRAYRAANLPPYELPKHKTRMTIKSQSHKGFGFNELRFEDELGQEEVFIHAERDQNNVVKQDETTDVGNDRRETVGNDEKLSVGHDQTVQIGNHSELTIGANQEIKIGADLRQTVGNTRVDAIGADHQTDTGGDSEHRVKGLHRLTAGQGMGHATTVYELQASERLVIKGPGGSITIDGEGVHLTGISITHNGPLITTGQGGGQELKLQLIPQEAMQCGGKNR